MSRARRIAVLSVDAKLGNEVRGATRYTYLASLLAEHGFEVDFITASFQHWEKRQRNLASLDYAAHPFRVRFIEEPSYPANMCPQRIWAHHVMARRVRAYFDEHPDYDLIYCQIPPNDVAAAAARSAHRHKIPFVIDVNDLWPEAFRMALNVPIISDLLFAPFARQARRAFALADAVVGTSESYAARAFRDRAEDIPKLVLYVGNDLATFDAEVKAHAASIRESSAQGAPSMFTSPAHEVFRVAYAGNISPLYDLATLVRAVARAARENPAIELVVLGDGPDRAAIESVAKQTACPARFLGYLPYGEMAAHLACSNVVVNSLVAGAPQSVPTKIGDYLAAGVPMINSSMDKEFRSKVCRDGFGINVQPGDVAGLADVLVALSHDRARCTKLGHAARSVAEREFDRAQSYLRAVELIDRLSAR
ncbi:glycosyltransferase family 4 protein [Collinsella sp. AGMB00827]|uniref:Glycosyltransferase family 4 protein n=1 Tax=Collinsella ureilytica TaxID=2869515 RepID=A0ABS7MIS9_9ACTN|nr:glycosyltransferase family 4 protein [Collinsella urealyticum]MBY4797001.1 glycosyltransferase family 4 protein [Collinsella urealyticum]